MGLPNETFKFKVKENESEIEFYKRANQEIKDFIKDMGIKDIYKMRDFGKYKDGEILVSLIWYE